MDTHVTACVKRVPSPAPFRDGLDAVATAGAAVVGDAALCMDAEVGSGLDERGRGPAGFTPASVAFAKEGNGRLASLAQPSHSSNYRGPSTVALRTAAMGHDDARTHVTHTTPALSSSATVHSRGSVRPLKHWMCCASRVHHVLRSLGILNDDADPANMSRILACSCATIGALLVLLIISFAALVVLLVVVVPDAQHRLSRTVSPLLDLNSKRNDRAAGGGRGGDDTASGLSVFDLQIRRLLASEGLEGFLRKAHRAADLRRRVQRNATLLAALRRANATRGKGAGDDVDWASLAQTLPELEHLSFLLAEVCAHVRAVQEHDPVMGLVKLSDFLLNVKGRKAALEKAAERARSLAANATSPAAAASDIGDAVARWNAALKESLAGRSEAARLRAQLRGFIGVSPWETERLTEQPFDDLALLQYRHAWAQSEVLPILRGRLGRAGARAAEEDPNAAVLRNNAVRHPPQNRSAHARSARLSPQEVAERIAMKADLYEVASIFNHVYYYPLRRYSALRPYGGSSVADTDAWYTAITAVVQTRFGVPITSNAAQTTETAAAALPLLQRDSPLSTLALQRLGLERAEEVARLHAEDRPLMPQALHSDAAESTHSIFVSLASYRDMECAPTLMSLFRTARNPHRLYVGVAQQNRAGDAPCLVPEMYTPYLCPSEGVPDSPRERGARARTLYGEGVDFMKSANVPEARSFDGGVCFLAEQVRLREIDARQAKGPTYGRYMAMLLYRGETLALVLDSHNRFRPMWDVLSATMLMRMEDPKAVLSHYPESYQGEQVDLQPYRTTTSYLCRANFLNNFGYLRLEAIVIESASDFAKNNVYNDPYVRVQSTDIDPATNHRLPQPWVAGGFLVSFGRIFRDVPFDPHLPYVFDGEEVLYSMRLWTHGYNIYSPARGACFHIYTRSSAPKVWAESPQWYSMQARVHERIQFLVQAHLLNKEDVMVPANSTSSFVIMDSSRYGMGKQRTVAQWYDYAGVDPVRYTLDGRWCGKSKRD